LKNVDIGVSMGINGADVARDASDMVLADDNFATIVSAVEEGRNIYDNVRKTVRFLFSSNIGEVSTLLLGILLNIPLPLLAVQILWVNLITDSLPTLALGMEPPDRDLMKRKPRKSSEGIINRLMAPSTWR
jgi:P-type Ca2+ transporter type 2C